jgi:hypothetical protein
MKKYKIAVLDDYQNVALESADWSVLFHSLQHDAGLTRRTLINAYRPSSEIARKTTLTAALNSPLMVQVSHFFFNSAVHLSSIVSGDELLETSELITNLPSGATSYWVLTKVGEIMRV